MHTHIALGALALAALAMVPATGRADAVATVLPTVYAAGHFYAVPETVGAQTLKLVVDTGGGGFGGMYWISAAAAKRLRLKTRTCGAGSDAATVAPVPDFRPGRGLPPPGEGPCGNAVLVQPSSAGPGADGQLGAAYLSSRIWTFNYPAHRLSLENAGWRPDPAAHATALGFQKDEHGRLTSGFARITIRVAGKPLAMLLDTGATAHPTAAGKDASHTPTVDGFGVASYITTSTLDRWHAEHPDWRVIADGDDLTGARHPMRLIEVPDVEIAGWSVGPVWFTERPDPNFHKFMAQWMDQPPDGAVGGNVFRHFVMTIDYPKATAYFHCVRGCSSSRAGFNPPVGATRPATARGEPKP